MNTLRWGTTPDAAIEAYGEPAKQTPRQIVFRDLALGCGRTSAEVKLNKHGTISSFLASIRYDDREPVNLDEIMSAMKERFGGRLKREGLSAPLEDNRILIFEAEEYYEVGEVELLVKVQQDT